MTWLILIWPAYAVLALWIALRGGSLADPALRIGTAGIYSSAADTLSVAIAGVERLPVRGGGWLGGSRAGVFALYLDYARSIATAGLGFRPAFVI